MEELEKKRKLLKAIREAIANMSLETDFDNIEITDELVSNIKDKVMKLGGINEF